MTAWLYLVAAGLLEVCWATGLKYTDGFTRPVPTLLTVIAIVASMWLLGMATKDMPIGTAYAVWVGIGATGAAILGAIVYSEPLSASRMVFLGMLVVSIIGLKMTGESRSDGAESPETSATSAATTTSAPVLADPVVTDRGTCSSPGSRDTSPRSRPRRVARSAPYGSRLRSRYGPARSGPVAHTEHIRTRSRPYLPR